MAKPIPIEDHLALYLETALRLGHTPKGYELPRKVVAGLNKHGMSIHDAARRVGITPNRHKCPPEPLPAVLGQSEPEEKVVVFEAPTPPNALTPEQLAAERAASLERQRRAREAEPRHRPLPYTGRERSRMWRVRSVEEEWDEDRRAMEAEVAA